MKNITKDKVTQIIRHVVQLISFIIYPGLFALCFNSIGVVYQLIITGTASIATLLSPILILAAIIPISIIWGRFFCSYICSFGAMQELFNWLGDILHIKKIQVPKAVDKYLKYLKYVVIAIFFLVWTLQVNIDSYLPWSAFGILTSLNGFSGVLSIGGIMLLLIVIGSLFLDRFFCKYLCPLGGVFRVVVEVAHHYLQVAFEEAGTYGNQEEGAQHQGDAQGIGRRGDRQGQIACEHYADAGDHAFSVADLIGQDTAHNGHEVHKGEEDGVHLAGEGLVPAELGLQE